MPQTLPQEKELRGLTSARPPFGRRLALALLAASLLSGCGALPLGEPQIPGARGLLQALARFQDAARWKNWPYLLEGFYLPDHAKEVRERFGGDAGRWFGAGMGGALLVKENGNARRRLCVLALREKRISPRFSPHFVVYYRVQRESCEEPFDGLPRGASDGRMEWGYEVKERRWVHLRPVG